MAKFIFRRVMFPPLHGIVFLLTILYVSMMTISDILYAVVDPRIRYT